MPALNEPLQKHLSASGAVTTDNKAGILHYCVFSGATVGDKCEIKNGSTVIYTLLTSVANEPVIIAPPERPIFDTDIDCTITKTGDAFATFIYEEIEE